MLDRLSKIFRSDAFIPGTAIFPDINSERIASDLKLVELGTSRGKANQPEPNEKLSDHVEMSIIERIEELRRKGLENFENNRRVYNERLSRATDARKEVEIVAGSAKGNFGAEVALWTAKFVTPAERLYDSYKWQTTFRAANKLIRPASGFGGWPKTIALAMLMLVIETILNGYLFAQRNEMGLIGGAIVALLVSLCNVGLAGILGYFSRNLNHRNFARKLYGLFAFAAFLCFTPFFNLAVAHFRDQIEMGNDWSAATTLAITAMQRHPFEIISFESWLLVILGCMVSFVAFMKGLYTDDLYPGYGHVSRTMIAAREGYTDMLEEALHALVTSRDDAIAELRSANEQVRQGISDSIDALFGQAALGSHLKAFLEQCDVKLALLLGIYRDANRQARTEISPKSFEGKPKFEPFKPETIEKSRKDSAEAEARNVAELVDHSIQEIFASFDLSQKSFAAIETVQSPISKVPEAIA